MANSVSESNVDAIPHVELQITNSSFNKRIHEFDIVNFGYKQIEEFLKSSYSVFEGQIVDALNRFHMIKTICYLSADFERAFITDDEQSEPLYEKRLIYIPTKAKEIDVSTKLSKYFRKGVIEYLKKKS